MDNQTLKTIDKKLNEGRCYRDMPVMEIRVAQEGEEDKKTVSGYATTFNEFYELYSYRNWDGALVRILESVDEHAFDECDMEDVILQYNHEGRVFARTSNKTLRLKADEHGLLSEADLYGTTIGQQLYEEIKGGYTTKMSFGFMVAKDERVTEEDLENNEIVIKRTITKISKLYDVSAVSIPGNNATEISARSFCEGVIAELEAEHQKSVEQEQKRKKIKIMAMV